ncbi:sensor histidine kinase [Sulfitobacter sp. M22]|jgi:signal transduction histidine kinase|uniref:sensor histidine kinase n=2 Tax=Roseobacteraceae TaxID=2854170 RepID=UPI001F3898FD|nr:ATP-binding protein [Sulfitobacter sp. M22]MCF7728405.1 hypothetical protein [Sulfitobacter sp. M22]
MVACAFILLRSWNELEESYLDQLDHLAVTLAQVLDAQALNPETVLDTVRQRHDRNMFVILVREGLPVLRSAGAPEGLGALDDGVGDYYLAEATARGGTLTVISGIERAEVRQLTAAIVGGAALPMALGLIGMAAVLLAAIRRALSPVARLREELEARRPDALDPVPDADLPEELVPLVAALNQLLERLDQAIAQERRFVADAGHELRTPLAAIRAQAETIDREALDPESRETLDQILRGVARSTRLAQQLLRQARADAVSRDALPDCALDRHITEIAAELFPQAVRHGAELELDCAPGTVRARPGDIEMLVGNLVENAIQHGGEAAHIRVSCGSDGGAGWLRVEDSGPGIAPEARAAVFGRFRRGAAAQGDGAGLGLSIVAAIVDRLDAQIVLERSPELGGLSAEIRFAQQQ